MNEKFTLRHDEKMKGYVFTFDAFNQSDIKVKVIAKRFRGFLRNHISASLYYALLREFTQDLEIGGKIVVKEDQLYR